MGPWCPRHVCCLQQLVTACEADRHSRSFMGFSDSSWCVKSPAVAMPGQESLRVLGNACVIFGRVCMCGVSSSPASLTVASSLCACASPPPPPGSSFPGLQLLVGNDPWPPGPRAEGPAGEPWRVRVGPKGTCAARECGGRCGAWWWGGAPRTPAGPQASAAPIELKGRRAGTSLSSRSQVWHGTPAFGLRGCPALPR